MGYYPRLATDIPRMGNKVLYAPYIDGLRAIAVLSVIAYHLNPHWLPGGFAGVDVFFVISGFVVAGSVGTLERLGLPRFFLYFYSRRLTRITPALVVCLVATSAALALLIPEAWLSRSNQETGLYAFFGLSNFLLAQGTGYFSPVAEFNPFTHTWSLAVEEQFYLVFPILFFAWIYRRKFVSTALFAAGVVASFIAAIWLAHVDQTKAFYLTWGRFWELGVGVLLFQLMALRGHSFTQASEPRRWFALSGDLATLALLMGLVIAKSEKAPFPACILPVAATAAVLGFLHGRSGGFAAFLLTRSPLRFIGKISYSLYLWHWPVFVLFRWTTGLQSPAQMLAALAIVAILSTASYYWIEIPPRRTARRLNQVAVVFAGIALIGIGYKLSAKLDAKQHKISISTVARNAQDWYPAGEATSPAHPGCVVKPTMTPIGTGFSLHYVRRNCEEPVTAPRVFAVGDSHAIGYEALYRSYVMETGAQVVLYQNGGCPFLSLQPGREDDESCKANTQASLADLLGNIHAGDVVFLPSLRLPRFGDQWAQSTDEEVKSRIFGTEAVARREKGVTEGKDVVRKFTDLGARVVFEAPKPIFRTPAFRCAETYNRSNPICQAGSEVDRGEAVAFRKPVVDALAQIAASNDHISIWDPFPILCPPAATCSEYRQGRPLFFDGDHLSGYGSRVLVPSFEAFVREK
ncbi:acyltransferase family protein [Dyella japonica]|uniref:Peptidoglycan/LPS O-acetylase OafA/YrhL n=1 Tax=Dyella japonica TaxID=231455 RepID=A0ABV2JQ91_9GAMM